jgi:hypothetical protein
MEALRSLNKKYLFTPKLLYFFINIQHYTLHKFRPLFAKEKFQISERELGTGLGFLLFVTFFTNIFVAAMNDKFGRPKHFIVGLLLSSCAIFQLFYVNEVVGRSKAIFWLNFFAYLATTTTMPAMLDKVILDFLNKIPNVGSKTYGKQRIWGTAGYTCSTFLLEALLNRGKTGKKYNFDNLRYYSFFSTAVAATLAMLFINPPGTEGRTQPPREDIVAECKELSRNRDYLFFIFIIFLNGLTRASMTMYLPIFIKDILKVEPYKLPKSWPGWLASIVNLFNKHPFGTISVFEALLEIVIFFNSQTIIQKVGLFWPLLLAQAAQLIRFVAYFMLDNSGSDVFAYCCLFELFKGINFGLTHGSGVQLAAKMCPPHLKATSQMVYTGTFTALGSVAAGVLFGSIFDKEKMKKNPVEGERAFQMFFVLNIVITLAAVVLFLYKYGVADNILFNPHVAEKKIEQLNDGEEDSGAEGARAGPGTGQGGRAGSPGGGSSPDGRKEELEVQ